MALNLCMAKSAVLATCPTENSSIASANVLISLSTGVAIFGYFGQMTLERYAFMRGSETLKSCPSRYPSFEVTPSSADS